MKDRASFFDWIRNRRVAVLGVGISNRPLIVWLAEQGVQVHAFDRLSEGSAALAASRAELEAGGARPVWHTGPDYLQDLQGFDLIFRTPRLQPDEPALIRARGEGAIISSEMEVFLTLCPAAVTAVTGSSGKTTTSSLIHEMYVQAGLRSHLGGNIGRPLLNRLDEIKSEDQVVVELSSFQLVTMAEPIETAVITNLTPNHLDVHPDFAAYTAAKKNIFLHQSFADRLILNALDEVSRRFVQEARGSVDWIEGPLPWPGTVVRRQGDQVELVEGKSGRTEPLFLASEVRMLGRFNVLNLMAAALAVWPRVAPEVIRQVARSFPGVSHRLELIRVRQGVYWYNSSIDSTPLRTRETIGVFAEKKRPLILIAGGADKNSDYAGLGDALLKATRRIVLCGANAPALVDVLKQEKQGRDYSVDVVSSYEEAIRVAAHMAKPGDSVVLSPTGTSFDRFHDFEERGRFFTALVLDLPES